jgi:DNA-binding MarR family transcriptional regulator
MEGKVTREAALDDLYKGVTTMARRSRDVGDDLHPGLSVVAYTLLTEISLTPGVRAADLCAHFGLDKSTVSRQLEQLLSAGLLRREGERPGRRGNVLALTPSGEQHLAAAAQAIRSRLAEWLIHWNDQDIATFAELVARFNLSRNQA